MLNHFFARIVIALCSCAAMVAVPLDALAACAAHSVAFQSPPGGGTFEAVASSGPGDAWAAGTYFGSGGPCGGVSALVEHWNGRAWTIVQTGAPQTGQILPLSVSAPAPNNVWIVGETADPSNCSTTHYLTLHWNGARWTTILPPDNDMCETANSVVALSRIDAWFVGSHSQLCGSDPDAPQSAHWNGAAWKLVVTPDPFARRNETVLTGVSADSPNDVWSAGWSRAPGYNGVAFVERWDGLRWSTMQTPQTAGKDVRVNGIAAFGPSDVDVVGTYTAQSQNLIGFTEHWNGAAWTFANIPGGPDLSPIAINGVGNNRWLAGDDASGRVVNVAATYVARWTGSRWLRVPSDNPSPYANIVYGVAAIPGTTNAWIAGYQRTSSTNLPLMLYAACR